MKSKKELEEFLQEFFGPAGYVIVTGMLADKLWPIIEGFQRNADAAYKLSNLRQNEISGLQKILDEKDIEIEDKKKELRKRWERMTEMGNEITNLKIELEAGDRNLEAFGSLLKDKVDRVKDLEEALRWYADIDNIDNRIKVTERWSAGEWITNASMYDDVTKVAEDALK